MEENEDEGYIVVPSPPDDAQKTIAAGLDQDALPEAQDRNAESKDVYVGESFETNLKGSSDKAEGENGSQSQEPATQMEDTGEYAKIKSRTSSNQKRGFGCATAK